MIAIALSGLLGNSYVATNTMFIPKARVKDIIKFTKDNCYPTTNTTFISQKSKVII